MELDTKEADDHRLAILATIRSTYAAGEYNETLTAFAELGETKTIRSGIRVEAIALAARAHTALDNRNAARQLLRQVWDSPLKNHRHCRQVAIACLELGEYRRAAALSQRAAEMVDASKGEFGAA